MKAILSLLVLLHLTCEVSADVIEATGDLRSLVAGITAHMRQVANRDSQAFSVPTLDQMSEWRTALRAVFSGDLSAADQRLAALAPSYKVVRFFDETTGHFYVVLVEAVVTDRLVPFLEKGWGTFIFDPEALRELSIQVPHPIADADTDREGIEALLQLGARSLLMAGTHRCANMRGTPSRCDGTTTACSDPVDPVPGSTQEQLPYRKSDVAHTPTNMFHQTHREIMRWLPDTVAIQLHSNNRLRPDGQPACPDVLISNTNASYTTTADGNVRRLAGNFDVGGVAICDPRPSSCNLCGTDNVQGRFTNGSPSPCDTRANSPNEQFIHIEQNRRFRSDFSPLIEALQRTFP